VRVFELGIAIASPSAGRVLAFHGADVFKVESPTSPDVVRLIGSAWLRDDEERGVAWPDSSPYVAEMNANKRSVALDLKHPGGAEAARRLLASCDVFLANFGARALAELGLDYASVREVKPDIVYVHLPGFGADPTAPYYPYVAWGPNQAPLVGLDDLTGHAGREPAGIATIAPPDYLSSFHAAFCVLAGLEQRDRTGEGVHVDISQFETTIALLLGPFAMDHALTGRVQSRIGNRSLWYAPEGVYPCRGEERWIAISVVDDEAWARLLTLAPAAWSDDPRFADNRARLGNADALDEAMSGWTAGFHNTDLAARLQDVGVAAHVVATNEDLLHDAHVIESGLFTVRPGTRFRRELFTGSPLRMSETPGGWERAGPSSGEHTVEVLTEAAGMTAEEVEGLIADQGAFVMDAPEVVIQRPYEDWLHVLFPGEAQDGRDL
jgi:benzylsuccinate CoA-transferase BbsF subunit